METRLFNHKPWLANYFSLRCKIAFSIFSEISISENIENLTGVFFFVNTFSGQSKKIVIQRNT